MGVGADLAMADSLGRTFRAVGRLVEALLQPDVSNDSLRVPLDECRESLSELTLLIGRLHIPLASQRERAEDPEEPEFPF